jgi:hypothetical protein
MSEYGVLVLYKDKYNFLQLHEKHLINVVLNHILAGIIISFLTFTLNYWVLEKYGSVGSNADSGSK